jgi:hypothetical protein
MTWYLMFALLASASASGPPHTQAYIAGPYNSKQECEKHEKMVDKHWCLVGCIHSGRVDSLMADFANKPPDPTCETLRAEPDF